MASKIRVLQINASTEYGGVSSMLFNIYKNIDRENIHFDFLSPNKSSFEIKRAEINELGGKIHSLNVCDKNKAIKFFRLYFRLKHFVKNHPYDIIHINSGSRTYNAYVSFCCKRNTNAKIIVHSHNGKIQNTFKDRIAKKVIEKNADVKLSCSDIASVAMFEKTDNVILIKNGIDAKAFRFSQKKREKIRTELGVKKDEKLIGNIGRLTAQKNQLFLLDIFREVKAINSKTKLLIVGSGDLEKDIKCKIKELGLVKSVIITSNRNDMPSIYSALDLFVLPSLYEGLPVSAIEAQYNGLPVILSSAIDKKTKISTMVDFCKLSDTETWKNLLIERKRNKSNTIIESFDIRDTAKQLEGIYYDNLR